MVVLICGKKGLPQWNKNWHSSGESLWYDRWRQIWQVKPRFVQIITCELPCLPLPFHVDREPPCY